MRCQRIAYWTMLDPKRRSPGRRGRGRRGASSRGIHPRRDSGRERPPASSAGESVIPETLAIASPSDYRWIDGVRLSTFSGHDRVGPIAAGGDELDVQASTVLTQWAASARSRPKASCRAMSLRYVLDGSVDVNEEVDEGAGLAPALLVEGEVIPPR